jgi:imidazolonepropionase-like amidohydrolase
MRTLLVLSALCACAPTAARAQPRPTIAVKAARLFDGRSDRVVADGVVIVVDGRIQAAGSRLAVPRGAQVIDLGDATLLPGLIDVHTHLSHQRGTDWNKDAMDGMRRGVPETTLHAAMYARRTLEAGFTTVRNVGAPDFIDVGLRQAIDDGVVPGPHVVAAASALGARGGHCDETGFPYQRFGRETGLPDGIAAGADGFRDAVRFQIKYGADVIKICATGGVLSLGDDVDTAQLTRDELVAIVDEAHRLRRKVAAHAHGDGGARLAVEAGVDSIEHGTFLSRATLELMKQRGTFLVPTLRAYRGIDPAKLPPELAVKARAAIAGRAASMKLAIELGVPLALGTDAGVVDHGGNAQEMVLLVEYGTSPAAALRAGTSAAADLIGRAADVGTLEAGKRADLVAVPGNPLDDITATQRVLFVMQDGRVVRNDRAR